MARRAVMSLAALAGAALLASAPLRAEPRVSNVTLPTPTGVLHGTLLSPTQAATQPVLILVLKLAPAERGANVALYADPDQALAPSVLPAIGEFVRAHARSGRAARHNGERG